MKYITIFLALTFSVMFSSSSYAGWTEIGKNDLGTYYVDLERIRKVDGYFYWWELVDLLKPTTERKLSGKMYNQGDCKLFRVKRLSASFYEEPMGEGVGGSHSPKNPKWTYPPPESITEIILKSVCNQ